MTKSRRASRLRSPTPARVGWYGLRFKRDEVLELWPPTETEVETGAEDPTAQTQREQDEPDPQTDAEIGDTQDGAREAEHDTLDDAGDRIDRSRKRPTEFTPEEQSKGGGKPKIRFGLLKYLEHLCDSGLAADFRKRNDITAAAPAKVPSQRGSRP